MKRFLIGASIFGATGVMFGALGAHALEKVLSPDSLASFQTGVRYQLFHALAILAWFGVRDQVSEGSLKWGLSLMSWGVVLFSSSIFLLSTRSATGWNQLTFLGPITPIGGLLLISGWITLLAGVLKRRG